MVLSSGDDTVNGTAAERGCIRREAAIPSGVPFVVATGNHDSDVTEAQMRSDGMTVLDGQVVEAGGSRRARRRRPGAQHSLQRRPYQGSAGERRRDGATAGRYRPTISDSDVILVHQPAAARVIMDSPNLPVPLVLWGHLPRRVRSEGDHA